MRVSSREKKMMGGGGDTQILNYTQASFINVNNTAQPSIKD